jgi:hypothetical protein
MVIAEIAATLRTSRWKRRTAELELQGVYRVTNDELARLWEQYARLDPLWAILADGELSIPAQLQAMRQYAAERNWQVLDEFIDAGVSR